MRGNKNIRMRINEDSHHKEKESFLKKKLKEQGVDLVVDQALNMANITMPLPMLSMMLELFKTLEKQLDQGITR